MKSAIILLAVSLAVSGCATTSHFETIYGSWVGQSLKSFQDAYGRVDFVRTEDDGNAVYKYRLKRQKNCVVYWVVNKQGVIVRWWHEGDCILAPFG
jgi:hypothetical protein